jgi:hypothetical protein
MKHLTKIGFYDHQIPKHLARRGDSDVVNLLWKGYLFALLEWKFATREQFDRLKMLLSDAGNEDLARPVVDFSQMSRDPTQAPKPSQLKALIALRTAQSEESDTIHLLMKGYTAALQLSQYYEPGEYHAQRVALKPIGDDELDEIFIGWDDEED